MKHGFPMTHVQTEVPDDDVQTDVPDDEYERLRAIADERGISIREARRQATEWWIEQRDAVDPEDPLFSSLDAVREASARRDRVSTSVTDEDDIVEEWTGEADEYRLSEPDCCPTSRLRSDPARRPISSIARTNTRGRASSGRSSCPRCTTRPRSSTTSRTPFSRLSGRKRCCTAASS
jgi:hypothetical protein